MFGSEPDLKMHVQNFGIPSPQNVGTKTAYFGFAEKSKRESLRTETRYRWTERDLNYKVSYIFQNFDGAWRAGRPSVCNWPALPYVFIYL